MRARFEKIPSDPQRSFRVLDLRLPRFDAPWHFHPEIELTLILAGRGRRFVGDSIERFVEGDLVLLGPNLPHFWHNEQKQKPGATSARAIVVQFSSDFLGAGLWSKPEFTAVHRLLTRAARGLQFKGPSARDAAERLATLPALAGLPAMLSLWSVLGLLATARGARPLASLAYAPSLDSRAEARMARVHAFLELHYTEPLTLPQLARVAALTPPAFSRYFKRLMGRNISDYINDLRIDHATRLLRETSRSITEIAADAGYATLSNFNRRFRERFGRSPRAYRRESDIAESWRRPP